MRVVLFAGLITVGSTLLGVFLNGLRDVNAENPSWWPILGGLGSGAIAIALLVLFSIPAQVWRWANQHELRSPLVRRDRRNPLQWLLDISKKQINNPTTHLVITDRIIMGVHLDDRRPRLGLKVCFANYGVNELIINNPQGYPNFVDQKSNDYIRDEGGDHNVPQGNTATSFNLDIYIPDEFLDDVRHEVESSSGKVSIIRLGNLRAMVRASAEGSPKVKWSIGGDREIFRPNR